MVSLLSLCPCLIKGGFYLKEYIEYLFKNYRKNKFKIKLIDIEIKEIENSYEGCTGLDMSKEKSSPTHKFSSDVENEVINKEKKIEKLKRNKAKFINEVDKTDCFLRYLKNKEEESDSLDSKLIEFKYIKNMSWKSVGINLGMDRHSCKDRKNKILAELEDIASAISIS